MRVDRSITPGAQYGRLTALLPSTEYKHEWICLCSCGTVKAIYKYSLLRGATRSCGCLFSEHLSIRTHERLTQHGESNERTGAQTPEYVSWVAMRKRCNDPGHRAYWAYGGRGITYCERWESYENFLADMGRRPSADHSLDRIDNDKGYDATNCRWTDAKGQARNKRNNHVVVFGDESHILVEWSEISGVAAGTISNRLKRGWPPERAIFEPSQRGRHAE